MIILGSNTPWAKGPANFKGKGKNILSIEPSQVGKVYSIDAEFESYCTEKEYQEPLKGSFMKVPSMKSGAIEVDDTD